MRAFISYSTQDRHVAASAKAALSELGITGFLAHEDLEISDEWKEEIMRELMSCELFLPLLSSAFKSSNWASQEIGIICTRPEVLIVPVSLDGTMPYGFISHIQGRRLPTGGVSDDFFVNVIARKRPHQIIPVLIERVARAATFRGAEAVVRPLVPLFGLFDQAEAAQFAEAAIDNSQVWSAGLCRSEYLPEFIALQKSNIPSDKLRALQYQVDNDKWYVAEEES